MTQHPTSEPSPQPRLTRWLRRHPLVRCAVLLLVMLAAWLVALLVASGVSGHQAIVAVSLAAAVCLVAGLLALTVQSISLGPQLAVVQVLLGMMLRMALPLAAAVIVRVGRPALAEADFLPWLIVFYFVGLLVEVPLVLAGLSDNSSSNKALKVG